LVQRVSAALPEDQKVTEKNAKAASATFLLLSHLWTTQGELAEQVAFGIPLLAADGTARKPGRRRIMVPPVVAWADAARRFTEAYPPCRVLSDRYVLPELGLLEALAKGGMVHPALLVTAAREELPERGLRPIASDPEEVVGATLRGADMAQIALL